MLFKSKRQYFGYNGLVDQRYRMPGPKQALALKIATLAWWRLGVQIPASPFHPKYNLGKPSVSSSDIKATTNALKNNKQIYTMNFDVVSHIVTTHEFGKLVAIASYLLVFLFLFSLGWLIVKHKHELKKNKNVLLVIVLIFILALSLRLAFYDLNLSRGPSNLFYVVMARSMALRGEYLLCDFAKFCLGAQKPYVTYPALLSMAFLFSGASVYVGYVLNVVIGSLTAVAMYFASYRLLKNQQAAILSAILMAIFLPQMFFTSSPDPGSSATLFALLSVAGFAYFFEKKDMTSHFFAVSSLGLCVAARLDHWFFLFFFLLWYMLKYNKVKKIGKRVWIPPLIMFSLIVPLGVLGYVYAFNDMGDASDFGLGYLSTSLQIMFTHLFNIPSSGFIFAFVLGVFGCFHLLWKRKYLSASLMIVMFFYLGVVLLYEHMSIENIRYLITGAAFGIIATGHIPFAIKGKNKKDKKIKQYALVIIILVLFSLPFFFYKESFSIYGQKSYPLYEFNEENKALLNQCYIIQNEPRTGLAVLDTRIYELHHDPEMATNPEHLKNVVSGNCVYYIQTTRGFSGRLNFQKEVTENQNLTLIKEQYYGRELIQLYRVNL